MDYYNLLTNSIWHINNDGTGFEKVSGYELAMMGGAYWWCPSIALMPRELKALGGENEQLI